MESSALIKQEDGVESANICRRCMLTNDALEALTRDESGQFTGLQIEFSPGVPSYLCTMCGSRLKEMDQFRWRCSEKNDLVDKFIKRQNTVKNESEITQEHLDQSAEPCGAEMVIKTEVASPDAANDLHLTQRNCTAGDEPFEAEENPIKLEYVDVDELYRLQTNAILDHEQDDLRTNPLELGCQDRENHSISNNICGDGTELLIKTEVNLPDSATDLNLNQRCCTVHEANWKYECYDNDLFEAEENPIPIKSEDEEVDEQHQLQTTNDIIDHAQDNQKTNPLESICQDQKDHSVTVAGNKCADDSAAESTQNVLNPGTRNAHSKSHSKNHKHHCPHCSATYQFLSSLKVHIRTHTDERPYQCKFCDKAFFSSGNLTEHSKIHNKDQHHQCPHCSSMFAQLASLKNHIRTHTGERPYQCKVCDKAFYSSTSLALHSIIHNKEQQHQCPYCSSMFARSSNLKIHIRTHTGEKPYLCKVCDKAFHSSRNLVKHSKIHNKDQQHQCSQCSSIFSRLYNLKRHIRTHTGKKPYQCVVCDKAFTSSSRLEKHSKIHKKDKPH